jgi:hypothetical protein
MGDEETLVHPQDDVVVVATWSLNRSKIFYERRKRPWLQEIQK